MSKISNWQPVIDKFKKRLSLWKARTLSFGGRLCLCKAVLGSLGTYFFSLYRAPKKVLHTLESLRRRFFWGITENSKGINWIAWNKVLREKKSGGPGIGSLLALNLAMLGKWRWREKMEPNANWLKVVRSSRDRNNRSSNRVWQRIKSIDTYFDELGINFSNLMQQNSERWAWTLEPSNNFSVCSFRKLIDSKVLPPADQETIWVKWATNKANIHLWRSLRNSLATMDNLFVRGVVLPSVDCKLCNAKPESLNHIFVDCSSAKLVSAHLSQWVEWWPTNATNVTGLWTHIDQGSTNKVQRNVRRLLAATFFWALWKQRNGKVFGGPGKSEKELSEEIKLIAFDWIRYRAHFGRLLLWEN